MRESLGLTQEQMAASTRSRPWPISRTTIGSIEKGQTSPHMVSIVAMTEALRIDPMEVLDRLKLAVAPPPGTDKATYEELDRQWRPLFHAGHFQETLAVLDRMAALIPGQPDSNEVAFHRAQLELRRATTLKRLGALTAARGSAERAIALSGDHADLHADSMTALADIHLLLGNIHVGVHTASAAVELSQDRNTGVACRALLVKGRAHWERREYEQARQAFLSARELAVQSKEQQHQIHCEGNIGSCLAKLGHMKHAEAQVSKAVELARTHRKHEKEALWLVELGRILSALNKQEEAFSYSEMALRIAQKGKFWGIAFRAVMLQHRLVRVHDPANPDRNRLHYLKKLYSWMEEHTIDEDVAEFLEEVGCVVTYEEEGES